MTIKENKNAEREIIEQALKSYHMQNFVDTDTGSGYTLVDMFTPGQDKSIERGIKEIELLADHIAVELDEATPNKNAANGELVEAAAEVAQTAKDLQWDIENCSVEELGRAYQNNFDADRFTNLADKVYQALTHKPEPVDNELVGLKQRIHNAKEVYIGMEGFIPETAPEAYCLRLLKEMYEELAALQQTPPVKQIDEGEVVEVMAKDIRKQADGWFYNDVGLDEWQSAILAKAALKALTNAGYVIRRQNGE